MGYILKNLHGGEWYIAHRTQSRWYLFDVEQNNGMTRFIWSKNINLCMSWSTQEITCDFLDGIKISQGSVNIVNKLYIREK